MRLRFFGRDGFRAGCDFGTELLEDLDEFVGLDGGSGFDFLPAFGVAPFPPLLLPFGSCFGRVSRLPRLEGRGSRAGLALPSSRGTASIDFAERAFCLPATFVGVFTFVALCLMTGELLPSTTLLALGAMVTWRGFEGVPCEPAVGLAAGLVPTRRLLTCFTSATMP